MKDMLFLMSEKTKGALTSVIILTLVIGVGIAVAPIIFVTSGPVEGMETTSYIPLLYVVALVAVCITVVGSTLYFKYNILFGLGLLQGIVYTLVGSLVIRIIVIVMILIFYALT